MVIMTLVITSVAIILVKESGFDSDGDGDYINQSAWIWIGRQKPPSLSFASLQLGVVLDHKLIQIK